MLHQHCNFKRLPSSVATQGCQIKTSFIQRPSRASGNGLLAIQWQPWNRELWWGTAGFVKHETKGGLAPLSTVSGLKDFRKMHTSTWKILYGTICMFAKLRFSFSENIYLEKKELKIFIPMQSFPSLFLNVVSVFFGPHSLKWQSNCCVAQFHDRVLSGLFWWFQYLHYKNKQT